MKAASAEKKGCNFTLRRAAAAFDSALRKTAKWTTQCRIPVMNPPRAGESTQLRQVRTMALVPSEPPPRARAPVPIRPPIIPCVAEMGSL